MVSVVDGDWLREGEQVGIYLQPRVRIVTTKWWTVEFLAFFMVTRQHTHNFFSLHTFIVLCIIAWSSFFLLRTSLLDIIVKWWSLLAHSFKFLLLFYATFIFTHAMRNLIRIYLNMFLKKQQKFLHKKVFNIMWRILFPQKNWNLLKSNFHQL